MLSPTPLPRAYCVELTSKCPFDCIFCSRQLRRGAGQHLPFSVFNSLLDSLVDPRKFILNYSGESTVYPDLIAAIQRARATGASAELVSVMASVPELLLVPLSESGLNRLTVSVHATDPGKFLEVYRHSSFDVLRSRLERRHRVADGRHPILWQSVAERLIAECRALDVPRLQSYYGLFASRIESFRERGLPADWDGTFTIEQK